MSGHEAAPARRYLLAMVNFDRRRLLNVSAIGLAGAAGVASSASAAPATQNLSALGRDAQQFGVRANSPDDQTRLLQRAIDDCARSATPLVIAPGVYRTSMLTLPANAQIIGVRGATKLQFSGGSPSLLSSEGADNLALTGLVFDGGHIPLPPRRGLVHALSVQTLRVDDCEILASGGSGIWIENVSGHVRTTLFRDIAATALVSFDAQGLLVAQNTILGTNDNGIEILRTAIGDDGTLVIDNRIEDIKAGPGGSGQYGNAINAFRAGNVIVRGNRIRNCDYSGVRGNSASNIQITGNSISNAR